MLGTRASGRGADAGCGGGRLMARYLFNQLGQAALLLVGVSVIGFALMHLAPGGPLAVYTLNPTVTAQDIERVKHQFGLDQPVYVQYVKWAGGLITGHLGYR